MGMFTQTELQIADGSLEVKMRSKTLFISGLVALFMAAIALGTASAQGLAPRVYNIVGTGSSTTITIPVTTTFAGVTILPGTYAMSGALTLTEVVSASKAQTVTNPATPTTVCTSVSFRNITNFPVGTDEAAPAQKRWLGGFRPAVAGKMLELGICSLDVQVDFASAADQSVVNVSIILPGDMPDTQVQAFKEASGAVLLGYVIEDPQKHEIMVFKTPAPGTIIRRIHAYDRAEWAPKSGDAK